MGAFYFLVEPTADRGSIETLHMQHYILGAEGLWCFQLCLGLLLLFLKAHIPIIDNMKATLLTTHFALNTLLLEEGMTL